MKRDVEKLKTLQTDIEMMEEFQVIEANSLVEERSQLCRKLERDLAALVYEIDFFTKSHIGIGINQVNK